MVGPTRPITSPYQVGANQKLRTLTTSDGPGRTTVSYLWPADPRPQRTPVGYAASLIPGSTRIAIYPVYGSTQDEAQAALDRAMREG
ncbi:hypothetical protein [Mycetocola saprophilus]|uniref:hypothetical protein n=1 Tax=Mycetocola saprophilus TaxID=76636 RepID=UPI003BF41515